MYRLNRSKDEGFEDIAMTVLLVIGIVSAALFIVLAVALALAVWVDCMAAAL